MTTGPGRTRTPWIGGGLLIVLAVVTLTGCASSGALRAGQLAERERNYDQAVVLYRRAVQERPHDRNAQLGLERAMLRSAQQHYAAGRALARQSRWEEALAEYQIAYELNPTMGDIERELADMREAVRTRLAARNEGQSELEALIERTRHAGLPGLELPDGDPLPDAVVFREASARTVFSAIGQFAGITVVFDPQFVDEPVTADLRGTTFGAALETIANSTRNFFQVTAPDTVTIIPDTPQKRREYQQEVVRTFYLSNADVTETIDLLRLVLDLRRIAPVTATNAVSVMDTPERLEAAARLVQTIDKARAEVVIEVQLLEVDRQTMRDYGLDFAAQGGNAGLTADSQGFGLTVDDIARLSGSDLFVSNPMSLFINMLATDRNTRILANPSLRTSDGIAAEAHFGERVPVPVTTFTPIAAGGVAQQPITSFNYEDIGVNINILPRIHHNEEVSLELVVEISNISGTGFGDLPQFGSREISTTLRLRDGETNILAGLIRDDERVTLDGIPGLNRVPVLGRLFGRTRTESQETDIILTLRPHIIRVLDLEEQDLLPFRLSSGGAAAVVGSTIPLPTRLDPQPRDPAQRLGGAPPTLQQPVTPPEPPVNR